MEGTTEENDANLNLSEEHPLMEPHIGLVSQGWRSLKERTETYVKNNWKAAVIAPVLVAAVGSLVTYYSPQSGSKSPQVAASHLPSFTTTLLQGTQQADYGIRMDPQIRDCSNEGHWKMTFPDLDYSLLGYDILYGYPLANGRDPGFRHPIFRANFSKAKQSSDCRYTYPEGFMVVPSESCVVSFQSKLIRNRQQMSEHLGVQASVEGGGWGFEFSASTEYKKDTAEMSTGEFLIVLSHAECQNYYSIIDFTNPPPFDPGFLSWAKKLAVPKTSDEAALEFVQYYGTHFFSDVTFGAKFVQHHKLSQKTFKSLTKNGISVEAQASYSGLFSIGGGFSLDKQQSEAASNFSKSVETITYTVGSTPPSNGDALTWAASVDQNPVPMLYSLTPIDVLFTEPFTKSLPSDVNYTAIRENLRNVSQVYFHALAKAGLVHSSDPRFHLRSEGVDISEKGYKSLNNVDNSTCLSFCRQDENCISVVYSQLHPPFKNSNCRLFNNTVNFTLVDPAIVSPPRQSVLIIPESRQKGFYLQAALIGKPFLVDDAKTLEDCDDKCFYEEASSRFCEAYTFNQTSATSGRCSLYTKKDITSIVYNPSVPATYVRL